MTLVSLNAMDTALSESFSHLLITRFNIDTGVGPDGAGIQPAWLESRLALFERFTLASVLCQEVDFKWILLLNADTPPAYRLRLQEYARDERVVLVYLANRVDDERIRQSALAHADDKAEYLVTTRLDNDDAIVADYLLRIQKSVRPKREFLNFALGYQMYEDRLYLRVDRSGPFITFVEPQRRGEAPLTVYAGPHGNLASVAPIRQILTSPTWIQVVHGGNIGNTLTGVRRPSRRPPQSIQHLHLSYDGDPLHIIYRDAGLGSARAIARVGRGHLRSTLRLGRRRLTN